MLIRFCGAHWNNALGQIFLLSGVCCLSSSIADGEPQDQIVLRHIADQANLNGFADLRGKQIEPNKWRAVTNLVGFDYCVVDWREGRMGGEEVEYYCALPDQIGSFSVEGRAAAERLERLIRLTYPSWEEMPEWHENDFVFEENGYNKKGRSLSGSAFRQKDNPNAFVTGITVTSILTARQAQAAVASREQQMSEFVADDVAAYIQAARTGFASFKEGQPQAIAGGWSWTTTSGPMLAERTEIQQSSNKTVLFCILSRSVYRGEIENDYRRLVQQIAHALPASWTGSPQPFGEMIASHAYQAPSGDPSGAVWIRSEPNGTFTLNFQVVTGKTKW